MAKRTNGEGSFTKLPSGKWRLLISVGYDDNGKRKTKSFTALTRTEAKQMADVFLNELKLGMHDPNKEKTFSECAKVWYRDYKYQVEASTYSGYQYTLKNLINYFGDVCILDIRQKHINDFLNQMAAEGRSRSMISKAKAMLIQIFDYAEANEIVSKNPALRTKMPKNISETQRVHHEKDAYTEEETKTICEHIPNNLFGNSIPLLLRTGIRVQELLALTIDDIAEDGSRLDINKAIKTVDGIPTLGDVKTYHSKRIVPVPARYRKYAKYLRDNGGRFYIFTSLREDHLYSVASYRRNYSRIIHSIPGIRYLTPHCCRHTYITHLQEKGVNPTIVKDLAGHADIQVTDGYTHISCDTLAKAVEVFSNEEAINHE